MSSIGMDRRAVRGKPQRLLQGIGLVTVAAILLSGCTMAGLDQGSTTRVLQSVTVNVDPAGAVTTIDGTAVSLDGTSGASTSTDASYTAADVVDDLPVRVTTQYRTADGSGADLSDVAGYSGRVEIEVTVENLTVAPTVVSYDAAGQSRSTPALVGTPLSLAGSAKLVGTTASSVVIDPDETRTTNGVVSADANGDAVVQWATLLAPPQTEAAATFRVVADVTDFSVPDVDVAAQAGLHTDLTFEGVLSSAFDTSETSELGLQKRAIALVTDVNGVLNRAGTTITEVRKNLKETSDTLGVRASQQLATSTTSLGTEMQSVGQRLTLLQTDLAGTVTSTRSAMNAQLSQIVASMDGLLGDTSGTPAHGIEGEGCTATVTPSESSGTLSSTFLQLAGLLDGYAEVNEGCRDQVVAQIDALLGPTDPDEESCIVSSMTCALFEAKRSVAEELTQLVVNGAVIIDQLNADDVTAAQIAHTELGETLASLEGYLVGIETGADDPDRWAAIEAALAASKTHASELETLRNTAAEALRTLSGAGASVRQQHQDIANMICALGTDPTVVIDPTKLDLLRAQLVDTKCDGSAQDPASTPPTGSLDARLDEQLGLWNDVVTATAPDSSALAQLVVDLGTLGDRLSELRSAADSDATTVQSLVADLHVFSRDALQQHADLGTLLQAVGDNQAAVKSTLGDELRQATDTANARVSDTTDEQIDKVAEQVEAGRKSLVDAYNATIAGLSSTSESVLTTGKTQIDTQRAKLGAAEATATATLDERTVNALEQINTSTSASTRGVAAASVLLTDSLNKVILDLGDPKVQGAGILGSMAASAAKSDTADYQLAIASQRAAGYANVRSEDVAGIMLRQAQFEAALEAAATLPAFHLDVPPGASSQTIYAFHLSGAGA